MRNELRHENTGVNVMANAVATPSTIDAQLSAVKSLVSQGLLTPEQGLVRMQAIHAGAAAGSNGGPKPPSAAGAADDERKPPRVARTPMVLSGPTQDELLGQLSTGKINVDQYKALSAGQSAKIDLAVSAKGWFSLYVKGLRFPITIPVGVAEALCSESGAAFVRGFIAQHSAAFDRK
jgi:hypothetical protein